MKVGVLTEYEDKFIFSLYIHYVKILPLYQISLSINFKLIKFLTFGSSFNRLYRNKKRSEDSVSPIISSNVLFSVFSSFLPSPSSHSLTLGDEFSLYYNFFWLSVFCSDSRQRYLCNMVDTRTDGMWFPNILDHWSIFNFTWNVTLVNKNNKKFSHWDSFLFCDVMTRKTDGGPLRKILRSC